MQAVAALLLTAVMARGPIAPAPAPGDSARAPASQPLDSADWHANGTLAFTDVSGNKTLTLFATKAEVSRRGGRALELTLNAAARYGRSGGETAVADYGGGGELRFLPHGDFSPFATATVSRDDVRHLALRLAASAGAAANVVNDSLRRVSVGLALLQDYERTTSVPGDPAIVGTTTTRTRISASLTGTLPIRPGVQLEHKTRFEPVANRLADYLFNTETAIRVLLSQHFALQVAWQFQRDTTPPDGVRFRNDRTLSVGLTVQTD